MKNLISISLLLMVVTGCSSNRLQESMVQKEELMDDMIQEDKMHGGELPSWVNKSGVEGGRVYVVGEAEYSADKSPFFVKRVAQMNAEVRLLSDAPSDFRILTQNAMTGAGIDSSEFYQIQTKLQEVVGLVGIKISQEKTTCRTIVRYGEFSRRKVRACYVQAHISAQQLTKAYQRTLALKFGDYKANEFKNLMAQELKRVLKNPLVNKDKGHELNEDNNTSNNSSNIKSSQSARLPAKEDGSPKRR